MEDTDFIWSKLTMKDNPPFEGEIVLGVEVKLPSD